MEIPEIIEKITFFGTTSDLDIYLKQFFFKIMRLIGLGLKKKLRKEQTIYVSATGKDTRVLCIFNITNA
jgi:hypothetical protein